MDIEEAQGVLENLFVEGFIDHCVLTSVSEIVNEELSFLTMVNMEFLSDLYHGPTLEDEE